MPAQRIIPWIVATALFMEMLDATILATAIPHIAQSFQVNPLELKLALTSYLLSLAIFIPISGWVADRWGTRTVFFLALMVFTVSSVWCGLSRTLVELVLARSLQGLGGAFMMPVGRLIIVRTFPKSQMVQAMNFVAIPGLLGPIMGPVIGGFITTYYAWPWIFYINVPIGLLGMICIWRYIRNDKIDDLYRLDFWGFVLFGLGLSTVFFGLEAISMPEISVWMTSLIVLCGGIEFVLFYWRNRKRTHSILNFQLFTIRTFVVAVLGNLWVRIGSSCIFFLIPLFFQIGYDVTSLESGLLISAWPLGAMAAKLFNKRLLRRWGFKKMLCVTSVSIGLTVLLFSKMDRIEVVWVMLLIFLNGIALSLQYTGMNMLYYVGVSHRDMSSATSIASTLQQLGTGLGIAICALILQICLGWNQDLRSGQIGAFHSAFFVMGLFIISSVFLFNRLKKDDGQEMIGGTIQD